jgi:hypothetical protein
MALEIYGASDDLIEIEGHITEELNCYATDEDEKGVLLVCSDGTVAEVKYGKPQGGIWAISVYAKGTEFRELETCEDEDAGRYSDTLRLGDGVKWVVSSKEDWQFIRPAKAKR